MADRRSQTFRALRAEVRELVPELAGCSDLRPGDLGGRSGIDLLRHVDGSLCRWAEDGIEPEDARRCVLAGADVYLNSAGLLGVETIECDAIDPQLWLRNTDARVQARTVPVALDPETRPLEISLYKGPDGQIVLHGVGTVRWGGNLWNAGWDGLVLPEGALLLSGHAARRQRA